MYRVFAFYITMILLNTFTTAYVYLNKQIVIKLNLKREKLNKTTFNNFENEIGAQPPVGFWDPLGILDDADQVRFNKLREIEMKHDRVSMLAILGHMVTTAGIRLPGRIAFDIPFSSIKSGLAAFEDIPLAGTIQIIGLIGLMESGYASRKNEIEEAQIKASGWDDETLKRKIAIELNNGRAAQMGILALMVHEKLNNDPYIINSLLGSPILFNR